MAIFLCVIDIIKAFNFNTDQLLYNSHPPQSINSFELTQKKSQDFPVYLFLCQLFIFVVFGFLVTLLLYICGWLCINCYFRSFGGSNRSQHSVCVLVTNSLFLDAVSLRFASPRNVSYRIGSDRIVWHDSLSISMDVDVDSLSFS